MSLDIDDQTPVLSPAARLRLVEAVAAASLDESEPPWLEWKGRVSSLKSWAPRMALYVLGFANRPVDWAQRHAAGWAYLLLGVEPGAVHGVVPADTADLQKWLTPYLGPNGPQWDPQYVEIDGHRVLVIAVPPPRSGDPIYRMRRSFQGSVDEKLFGVADGQAYIRAGSETRPATSAEQDLLDARASKAPPLTVSVSNRSVEFRTIDWRDEVREAWVARERQRLMAGVDDKPVVPEHPFLAGLTRVIGENRGPVEYGRSVEDYLVEVRRLWHERLMKLAATHELATLRIAVTNESVHNFGHNELVLEIVGMVAASWDGEWDRLSDPEPPRPWGEPQRDYLGGPSAYSSWLDPGGLNRILHLGQIDISGKNTTIRYPEFDLRPEEIVELEPVVLGINDAHAGSSLPAKWRLTSKSVSGVVRGELQVRVCPERVAPL
jgi:hypothetical protein